MIVPDRLAGVTAAAAVPEQVVPYVCAVAGSKPQRVGACVGYAREGEFVLVGYPLHDPRDTGAMTAAVDQALKLPGLRRIVNSRTCSCRSWRRLTTRWHASCWVQPSGSKEIPL